VTIKKRAICPDGSNLERRKSQRFQLAIPIEASWRGHDGRAVKESAVVKQVNAQGALLKMATYPETGSRVTLTNFLSAKTAEARVLATPYAREGVSQGIAVELVVPSESFWGVSLQVKKASQEVAKLEKCLQSEGIDLRLLREFQNSITCIRMTAQAVQEFRQCQLDGREDDDIVALLTTARLQRFTELSLELMADWDAGRVDAQTKGINALQQALDQACSRLRGVSSRSTAKSLAKGQ
jgi:hypothetical protein